MTNSGSSASPSGSSAPQSGETAASGAGSAPSGVVASLALGAPSDHLDTTAREPMLIEHPDGSIFVAGYQRENPVVEQPPALWKSVGGGDVWERVDVGTVADGAVGNSDVDLALAPDGTLYFATMGFDRTEGVGTHVAVGISRDAGLTWEWTLLTDDRAVDRPWIAIDLEGIAHVVWNDGRGVAYRRSEDGGRVWTDPVKIAPRGGSSHLAVGPRGELAVRVTPLSASGAQRDDDAEWILVSVDGGRSFERHEPPGARVFEGIMEGVPRWVEPLAWDAEGALYYLWSGGNAMWLGRSADRGATWDAWLIDEGEEVRFYPYLIARHAGELAATWFSGEGEGLTARVALIDASAAAAPRVTLAPPFQPDSRAPSGARDPAGEYLPVIFLSGGGLAVASPIQDAAAGRFGFSYRRVEIR